MRRFMAPAIALLTLKFLVAQELEFRKWKDVQGRQIEAALTDSDDTSAVLTLTTGTEIKVPLESLSDSDKAWIAERSTEKGDDGKYDGPAAEADWPRTVSLKEVPKVRVIREDREKKEFVYESDHYEFVCDSPLGANLVREFSRVFEATWLLNCRLPLDFKPVPEPDREKFRARIFTSKQDYMTGGGVPGSAGVYSSGAKALMLPLSSLGVKMFGSRVTVDYSSEDYKTLIHEITHQMMNRWLERIPTWYAEGAAVYVELSDFQNGRFSFVQQDDRLKHFLHGMSGGNFKMVPLQTLMIIDGHQWSSSLAEGGAWRNYASALALTYYFYHLDGDGKGTHFKEYLQALENLKNGDDPAALVEQHLMRGRDYAALQSDVQKGMRRLGITVTFAE